MTLAVLLGFKFISSTGHGHVCLFLNKGEQKQLPQDMTSATHADLVHVTDTEYRTQIISTHIYVHVTDKADHKLFSFHSIPMLLQWHVKDPCHSAKSAAGRLHLNTLTPLTKWNWSRLTLPQFRHRVGTYQITSSHSTHQGTLSYSHLSSLA